MNVNPDGIAKLKELRKDCDHWPQRFLDLIDAVLLALDGQPERHNAGVKCDMNSGPCACGAWHDENDRPSQAAKSRGREIAEKMVGHGEADRSIIVVRSPTGEPIKDFWQIGFKATGPYESGKREMLTTFIAVAIDQAIAEVKTVPPAV